MEKARWILLDDWRRVGVGSVLHGELYLKARQREGRTPLGRGFLIFAARSRNMRFLGQLSLLQNYKNTVTPAEAGVQKPLTSLDSCFRRNDRKKQG